MADSETSGGRRRREEEQNVGSYGKDLMDLIANKNPEPEAPDLRPNAQPWIPMQREEEEDGGSISSGLNNDSPWEQIVTPVPVPEPEPVPEPQPQPQPEPAPVIDTGRLGANLNIETPTLSETQSPVESVVPTATPTVTEPQTTSQPRRRGEERAEATMLAPVTQPVTTPSQENTTPVTRPSRHSKTTSSVSEQNEQAPTPSSTYQEWMNYLAQQEAAQQAGNTQNSQFVPQQDVSVLGNGYVRPLDQVAAYGNSLRNQVAAMAAAVRANQQHFLGAGPAEPGTMNYPTATGPVLTGLDNYGLGQVPRDYQTPYEYNPDLTVESLVGHNYQTPYEYNPDLEDLIQEDYDTQVRIQMDRGYPRDIAERIAAGTYTPDDQLMDMYGGTLPQYNPQHGLFEDPQWLQDLTGGNSLAGVAANALDSILRIGSGGPVQPVTEDPLAPVGDWLLGQMIGEENVAPAVALGNSIAQNPVVSEAAREIGDYLLDQQLGKANADELRSRFGIETTPTTIMNQPQSTVPDSVRFAEEAAARRNNAGSSAPQSPAPQATAPINTSGSQPTVFDSIGNWFSSQFGNNNAAGSSTPQTTTPSSAPQATAPATTPSTTPSTAAPQTTGSQGGSTTPYPSTNRYNPDSSAYYSSKFDDIMENTSDVSGETARRLLASPITIGNDFSDLIATDFANSSRDPLTQQVELTDDQYRDMILDFGKTNPAIAEMVENGQLSFADMVNLYFKDVVAPGTGASSSSGKGSGSGVPAGSLTLPASYGQESGKVVKAPYRKGGYTEAELKAMGNSPYITNRGYTGYEGYYYNVYDKKWYPVDQNKANYYNRYGTYNGYTQDKADYYNTFGTYNGYRQGWQSAGRSGGGGGSRGGGGGYSSSRSSSSGVSYQTPTTTPRRAQSSTNGYYYGNNYNYQQPVTPNAVKQQEQRINNIMKNWTF